MYLYCQYQSKILRVSILYQIFTFCYTLTILIIAIFAYNNYHQLPIPYLDAINNWKIDPIYEIYKADTCPQGSEQFFLLQNTLQRQTYTKWWNSAVFSLCYTRLSNYNFQNKFQIYPKCLESEEICGGVYVQNKYCAPKGKCPLNSLLFVNSAELAALDNTKYTKSLQIEDNFHLAMSSLAESQPISEISIFGSQACIPSSYSNYDTIFSSAFCQLDQRFTLLNQISESNYASANSFTLSSTKMIGVYSRSYTSFAVECRQKNLVGWGIRSIKDGDSLKVIQPLLMIVSAINFGLMGFLLSLFSFLQYYYKAQYNPIVNKIFIVLKTITSYFHSILIVLAFGLWIDLKLFLQLSVSANCSDATTTIIINHTQQNIDYVWKLNLTMFIIFLLYAVIECSAFSLFLDRIMKQKHVYKFNNNYPPSSLNQSQTSQQIQLFQHFNPSEFPQQQKQQQQQQQQQQQYQSDQQSIGYNYFIPQSQVIDQQDQEFQQQSMQSQQIQNFQNLSPQKQFNVQESSSPASRYESFKGVQKQSMRYEDKMSSQIEDLRDSNIINKYKINN